MRCSIILDEENDRLTEIEEDQFLLTEALERLRKNKDQPDILMDKIMADLKITQKELDEVMPNIFDAAKYILKQNGPTSTMKLQKLCFYSQAWSLVWDDDELFPEDFEAWANGPVCPELFNLHRGKFKIAADEIPDSMCSSSLSDDQIATVDKVLESYATHDAQWLSTLTHMEQPWKDARKGCAPGDPCSNIITKESMAMYYGGL